MAERKRNNASWCCDQIEEKIADYKVSIEETEDEHVKRQLQIIVDDLENILKMIVLIVIYVWRSEIN